MGGNEDPLECSSISNGNEGTFHSFHCQTVSSTAVLKTKTDANVSPNKKKLQTKEAMQKRITKLEQRMEWMCSSIVMNDEAHVNGQMKTA